MSPVAEMETSMSDRSVEYGSCFQCQKVITSSALQALGNSYHLDCFRCSMCSDPLRTSFTLRDGVLPTCAQCTDEAVNNFGGVPDEKLTTRLASRKTSYSSHALPPTPTHQLSVEEARERLEALTGLPEQEEDSVDTVLAESCLRCHCPVTNLGIVLEHSPEKMFHECCFFCDGCGRTLIDEPFCMRHTFLYHPECFRQRFCDRCFQCKELIVSGKFVDHHSRKFHVDCFMCTHCQAPLANKTFAEYKKLPYCVSCPVKKEEPESPAPIAVPVAPPAPVEKREKKTFSQLFRRNKSNDKLGHNQKNGSHKNGTSDDAFINRPLPETAVQSTKNARKISARGVTIPTSMPAMSPTMARLVESQVEDNEEERNEQLESSVDVSLITSTIESEPLEATVEITKEPAVEPFKSQFNSVALEEPAVVVKESPKRTVEKDAVFEKAPTVLENTETNKPVLPSAWRGRPVTYDVSPPTVTVQPILMGPLGTKDVCVGCNEKVHEGRKQGPMATVWHAKCLVCHACKKSVDSFAIFDSSKREATCRTCHLKKTARSKPNSTAFF